MPLRRCAPLLAIALSACALPHAIVRGPPLPGLPESPAPAAQATPPAPPPVPTPAPVTAELDDDARDLALAEIELQKAQTYTGLTDAQLTTVRLGELAIARGQGRKALDLLSALTRERAEKTKRYVVAAGDSLWIIAGREDVYANSWLWPLIWQANLDTIPDPDKLLSGQKLKIRPNPTIEEVVKAVDYARNRASRSVHIGEVREGGQ